MPDLIVFIINYLKIFYPCVGVSLFQMVLYTMTQMEEQAGLIVTLFK